MNKMLIAIVAITIAIGGWLYYTMWDTQASEDMQDTMIEELQQVAPVQSSQPPSASGGGDNLVEFACDGGKRITAVFRPESVGLTLSDGRQMELQQVVNGSDINYRNEANTIRFLGRGEGGALIEGEVVTYENCVAMI